MQQKYLSPYITILGHLLEMNSNSNIQLTVNRLRLPYKQRQTYREKYKLQIKIWTN